MSRYGYCRVGEGRYRERFGLSFEDIRPGMTICHRPGVDISQQDNRDESLDLINNAHLHYDSHYASKSEWQNPLFVSTLTIQHLFGMMSRSWYRRRHIVAIESIALTRPLFGGDTLYVQTRVLSVADATDPDTGRVRLEMRGINAHERSIAEIVLTLEVYRRGRHPEDADTGYIAEEERFLLHRDVGDDVVIEQSGLWFEDFAEGETFAHWPGRTISADEVRTHALRSLDINPRWHDVDYLARYPQIEATVPEALVIGVVTGLTTRTMGRVVANLGWTRIELPRPVRPGQTLYAESTILELRGSRSRPDQGLARVETRAVNDLGELVCLYERALLVYRKGAGPYEAANY